MISFSPEFWDPVFLHVASLALVTFPITYILEMDSRGCYFFFFWFFIFGLVVLAILIGQGIVSSLSRVMLKSSGKCFGLITKSSRQESG